MKFRAPKQNTCTVPVSSSLLVTRNVLGEENQMLHYLTTKIFLLKRGGMQNYKVKHYWCYSPMVFNHWLS